MIGRIVCSKAGRDKGSFMVITELKGENALVCDGKKRPLENPKLKNRKHLAFTNTVLEAKQFESNRSLRRAINEFCGGKDNF